MDCLQIYLQILTSWSKLLHFYPALNRRKQKGQRPEAIEVKSLKFVEYWRKSLTAILCLAPFKKYVWHLSKILNYFIFDLLFRCFCIWVSFRRDSNKGAQRQKTRYFHFSVQKKDTLLRGVCFSPEKHRLFNYIINDSPHSGIETKGFRSSDNNNDITVKDLQSVKKTELNFERKTLQSNIFTTEQVINECAIYDIVGVTGLIYNLQTEAGHGKYGKPLRIRKRMIKMKQ